MQSKGQDKFFIRNQDFAKIMISVDSHEEFEWDLQKTEVSVSFEVFCISSNAMRKPRVYNLASSKYK